MTAIPEGRAVSTEHHSFRRSLSRSAYFFERRSAELDALLLTAERGAAWTLIHPEYTVAIPQPTVLAVPVAMGMARNAEPLADFINAWLRLKREDGTVDELYQYWILGGGAKPQHPRWSIIRDVLGWIE